MTTFKLSIAFARQGLSTITIATLLLSAARTPVLAGNVCISMSNSNGVVAGVQLDLKWDGSCMSAETSGGTKAKCTADSSTGKDVHSALKAGPTLTALFFSMSDTNPIGDGDLFCCSFTRSSTAGNPCCGLSMGRVSGSDSTGRAIPASDFNLQASMDGQICSASGGGGGGSQGQPPVRSGLQGGGVAPPVVSVPGGAPAAGAPPAPAGGQPGAPAGSGAAPEPPAGMDQVQRALEQLAPRQAPTVAAAATAAEAVSTLHPAAGTPTVKAHPTEVHGTPTAAAKKTPSVVATAGAKTPGATPEATPKAEH